VQKNIIIISAVALVIIGAFAVAVFFGGGSSESDAPGSSIQPTDVRPTRSNMEGAVPETKSVTEGWRSYENKAYNFALLYPQELSVREYKEQGGAMSATFENPATREGFQIYVTPYGAMEVTKERFRLDAPSGVMEEPTDVLIDGVPGTIFWSKNSIMGDTREVWFINGGFLYEVVTYKQLDEWLGTIMQTWQFLP